MPTSRARRRAPSRRTRRPGSLQSPARSRLSSAVCQASFRSPEAKAANDRLKILKPGRGGCSGDEQPRQHRRARRWPQRCGLASAARLRATEECSGRARPAEWRGRSSTPVQHDAQPPRCDRDRGQRLPIEPARGRRPNAQICQRVDGTVEPRPGTSAPLLRRHQRRQRRRALPRPRQSAASPSRRRRQCLFGRRAHPVEVQPIGAVDRQLDAQRHGFTQVATTGGVSRTVLLQGRFDEAIEVRDEPATRPPAVILCALSSKQQRCRGYRQIEVMAARQELEALRGRAATGYVSPLDFARAHAHWVKRSRRSAISTPPFDRAPGLVF